jgi:hypothetical protein
MVDGAASRKTPHKRALSRMSGNLFEATEFESARTGSFNRRFDMKSILIGAATGIALAIGSAAALAQTVVIAPEQETVIREYITTQQVQPVEIPADVEVTVGATLPETVEVHALEVPDLETQYSYIVVDGRTILVEPDTRKVVHIIE